MKKLYIAIMVLITSAACLADPILEPTTFLNAGPPDKMCQDFLDTQYEPMFLGFVKPSAGASIRIDMSAEDLCIYIFCDNALNRLMMFSLFDDGDTRTPYGIKAYGGQLDEQWFTYVDSVEADTILLPSLSTDSIGYFFGPLDVCVSANGRHFDPEDDYIYVLDQGNRRAVKFQYDIDDDTLIWVSTFGDTLLEYPTAIDYADYGDSDPGNDDVYITDGILAKVFRFSADGEFEESYGARGTNLAMMGYPTGIAIGTDNNLPNRFYISDSKNHRVVMYYSTSDGPIMAETQYIFPHYFPPDNSIPYIIGLDTDGAGDVYVLNSFAHKITILSSDLTTKISEYGEYGFEEGDFNYPSDIYIDNTPANEYMQICEKWDDLSGIQSFAISYGLGKPSTVNPLPRQFRLYQNYPNPFNSRTLIHFDLPSSDRVTLTVFNILGQKVATLLDTDMPAGSHSVIWDGKNTSGDAVTSGLYLYRIQTSKNISTKKLVLLK